MIKKSHITWVLSLLTAFLVLGIPLYTFAQWSSPATLNSESHPFILWADGTEKSVVTGRVGGAPYSTWYSSVSSSASSGLTKTYSNLDRKECGEYAAAMAFKWAVVGGSSYLDSTISAITTRISYGDGGGEFKTPEGVIYNCIAYDIIYDEMTSAERDSCRNIIIDYQDEIQPTPGTGHNGTSRRAFAAMLSALSVESGNNSWAQTTLNGAVVLLDSLFSYYTNYSGVWWEGSDYTRFGFEFIQLAHNAFLNASGVNMWDDTDYRNFVWWMIFSKRASDGRGWSFDDSKADDKGNYPGFVNETMFGDTAKVAQGFYSNLGWTGGSYNPDVACLAYYTSGVSVDTSGISSQAWDDAGIAVLSDNWKGESGYEAVFVAEPFDFNSQSSHEDYEGMVFELYYKGVEVIVDPGYGQNAVSYEPGTKDYFEDWDDNNTMDMSEVDGSKMYQTDGFAHSFTNDYADYVEGYGTHFGHDWNRGFLLWKSKWVFLFDWVDDSDADNQYYWYFMTPGRDSWSENQSIGRIKNDTMGVKTYIRQTVHTLDYITQDDYWYEFDNNEYRKSTRQRFYRNNSTETDITSIFVIQAMDAWSDSVTVADGTNGCKANNGTDTLRALIQQGNSTLSEYLVGGDGELMAVADDAGTIQFWVAKNCSNLDFNSSDVFDGGTNVDGIMLEATGDTRNGYVQNSTGSYTIGLYLASEPDNIEINGGVVSHSWAGGKATVTVTNSGKQTLQVNMTGGSPSTPSTSRRRIIIMGDENENNNSSFDDNFNSLFRYKSRIR
jgi:hypothetical protein